MHDERGCTVGGAWVLVCRSEELLPDHSVAAEAGGRPVAVVRTSDEGLYALGTANPCCGPAALLTGRPGRDGDVPTLATSASRDRADAEAGSAAAAAAAATSAAAHQHVFDLRTGQCFDDPRPVRVVDGYVEVGL